MSFNDVLTKLNDIMYSYILIIMLIGAGIYFTIRTRDKIKGQLIISYP